MVDQEQLRGVREAAARLAENEREVLLARAEYHTGIRRLHLAGASLREIAQALELSHQRVQQVVQGAGGTWWSRLWRTRKISRDAVCTFCARPPSEVAKLVAGPNVYICEGCVTAAERAAPEAPAPVRSGSARSRKPSRHCSFCLKDPPVFRGSEAQVCARCLVLCREIMEGR